MGIHAMFDLPWAPIYIVVIFMLHPLLGAFSLGCALLLVLMALINEWLVRPPIDRIERGGAQELRLHRDEPAQCGGGAGDGHERGPAAALGPRSRPHDRAPGHGERSRRGDVEHDPVPATCDAVADPGPRRVSRDRATRSRSARCLPPASCSAARCSRSSRSSGSWRNLVSARAPITAFAICWRPIRCAQAVSNCRGRRATSRSRD